MIRLSEPFLQLARAWKERHPKEPIDQPVALWCLNQPPWYSAHVRDRLGLSPVRLAAAQTHEATRAVNSFSQDLPKRDVQCVFLLEDGRPLANAYQRQNGRPGLLRYGRAVLPDPSSLAYLYLFYLVNWAALEAGDEWGRFRQSYRHEFLRALRNEWWGSQVEASLFSSTRDLWPHLHSAAKRQLPILLVDTGMQGSLALAVVSWLEHQLGAGAGLVDVRLLAVYPWLRDLYRGRHAWEVGTSVLVAVEQLAEAGRTIGTGPLVTRAA
jgi:hypothetical protein